jgi:MFS family permease
MSEHTSSLQATRISVLLMFFLNGSLMANWVSRIPAIKDHLDLSAGVLGVVLLGIALGTLTALSLAGGLIARYGSRKVTIAGAIALCLTLPPLAVMPHPAALWLSLFLFGAAMSFMDVAMNTQGIEVERRSGKALMSSFHAAFSIGGFVGAAVGAGMAALDVTPLLHFAIIAVVFLALLRPATAHLIVEEPRSRAEKRPSAFQLPPRILWPLGAVAFCSSVGEGSMGDWSAVYLKEVVITSASVAAFGYAAFSLTMTIGRLLGDRLVTKYGPAALVRVGGTLAALGLLAAVILPDTGIVLIGFAAVGAGLSFVVPLVFSAAGNVPGLPSGAGIAGVATIGYAGFLAGPPLIGVIADLISLRASLLLVALLASFLIVGSRALSRPQPAAAVQPATGD